MLNACFELRKFCIQADEDELNINNCLKYVPLVRTLWKPVTIAVAYFSSARNIHDRKAHCISGNDAEVPPNTPFLCNTFCRWLGGGRSELALCLPTHFNRCLSGLRVCIPNDRSVSLQVICCYRLSGWRHRRLAATLPCQTRTS